MLELLLAVISSAVVVSALVAVTRAARAGRSLERGRAAWFAVLVMAAVGATGVYVSEIRDALVLGRALIVLAVIVGFAPVVGEQRRDDDDDEDGGT